MPSVVNYNKNSANADLFKSNQPTSAFAEVTKKAVDIGGDFLKAGNKEFHFFKASMPIISFLLGIVGFTLQAYAVLRDKKQPRWLKALALLTIGVLAVSIFAIVMLGASFPAVTLALSFTAIAIGCGMECVKFAFSLGCLIKSKLKILFPSRKDNSEKIELLHAKRAMYNKLHNSLVHQLHLATNEKEIAAIQSKLHRIQLKIVSIENALKSLVNPQKEARKKYEQYKKGLFDACFGLSVCIGSSIVAIMGLTLAVTNPPLGIALIGLGLVFDALSFFNHVKKWSKNKKTKAKERTRHGYKQEQLLLNSTTQLNNEHRKVGRSYEKVLVELKNKPAANEEVQNPNEKQKKQCHRKYRQTVSINNLMQKLSPNQIASNQDELESKKHSPISTNQRSIK